MAFSTAWMVHACSLLISRSFCKRSLRRFPTLRDPYNLWDDRTSGAPIHKTPICSHKRVPWFKGSSCESEIMALDFATLSEANMETQKGPKKDYSPSKRVLYGFPC